MHNGEPLEEHQADEMAFATVKQTGRGRGVAGDRFGDRFAELAPADSTA